MPAPVATLGYRSKREAAAALAESGLRPKEIAPMLGLSKSQVYNLLPGRLATQGKKKPRGVATHFSDTAHDPEGPFTYAEDKPSSLIDELKAKAREREARVLAGPARRLCLLVRADGAFLAEDGMAFTPARDKAGRWTEAEIVRMRGQNPAKRALTMELA